MYGYSITAGRMKEYDDDCLTRRALGEGMPCYTTLLVSIHNLSYSKEIDSPNPSLTTTLKIPHTGDKVSLGVCG